MWTSDRTWESHHSPVIMVWNFGTKTIQKPSLCAALEGIMPARVCHYFEVVRVLARCKNITYLVIVTFTL